MSSQGCVYSWCGCRDTRGGQRMGVRCPLRGQEAHGSWYLSLELPPALDWPTSAHTTSAAQA
jgi:hypothetical protein